MFQLAKESFFLDPSKKKNKFSPLSRVFVSCYGEISLEKVAKWEVFTTFARRNIYACHHGVQVRPHSSTDRIEVS